jgi:hypothetical protein
MRIQRKFNEFEFICFCSLMSLVPLCRWFAGFFFARCVFYRLVSRFQQQLQSKCRLHTMAAPATGIAAANAVLLIVA